MIASLVGSSRRPLVAGLLHASVYAFAWSTASTTALHAQTVADGRHVQPTSSANDVFARPVTVTLKDVTLESAVMAITESAGVRVQYRLRLLDTGPSTVSLHAVKLPLGVALSRVLAGTRLQAVAIADDLVTLKLADMASQGQGEVRGKVVDGKTKLPIANATVALADAKQGVTTGSDGAFRLPVAAAGQHQIAVRAIGYLRQNVSVTVNDGQASTVDVALEPGVNTLDQVVVTGTVTATQLKAVPNAITVITAKDIEQRGITRIDQLFRGDVPGLFAVNKGSQSLLDEVTMFSRGATSLSSRYTQGDVWSAASNPMKTYVDGVEMADATYLSQIDPRSIERIEILSGPQASTIYGSNAINGVMQIFTKRGGSVRPQVVASLLSGFIENNFRSSLTPQHDYSLSASGTEGRISYSAGSSWNYTGAWTPAKQMSRLGGFGGVRFQAGPITADASARVSSSRNNQRGSVTGTYSAMLEDGSGAAADGFAGRVESRVAPQIQALTGQTLGASLIHTFRSWWTNEFGIGLDQETVETRKLSPSYQTPGFNCYTYGSDVYCYANGDSSVSMTRFETWRKSLQYKSSARIPLGALAQATITGGIDSWESLGLSITSDPLSSAVGTLDGTNTISREPGRNTGTFVQGQLGLIDKVFFTYGLRAEWNPNYGEEAQPNVSPRYGVAYTQDVGTLTAKLRASYGRSTRPPLRSQKEAISARVQYGSWITSYYPEFDAYLPNPELAPETQRGTEVGLELYAGNMGSLVLTRFDQTVDGLISAPTADSVRSLAEFPPVGASCRFGGAYANYGCWTQNKNLNIGSIRNLGWEAQASVNVGPMTLRGTYSWTKSRVIGINPKYAAQFDKYNYPTYQPGATFGYLPEHTGAVGVTYAHGATSVAVNMQITGAIVGSGNGLSTLINGTVRPRLQASLPRLDMPPAYRSVTAGYAMADVNATHRINSWADGVLQIQNLADYYRNDMSNAYAVMGRQSKAGLRLRF